MDVTDLFLYVDDTLIIDDCSFDMNKNEMKSFLVGLSFYEKWEEFNPIIFAEIVDACRKAESTRDLLKKLEVFERCELISTPKFVIFGFSDYGSFHLVMCEKSIIGYKPYLTEVATDGESIRNAIVTIMVYLGQQLSEAERDH